MTNVTRIMNKIYAEIIDKKTNHIKNDWINKKTGRSNAVLYVWITLVLSLVNNPSYL